MFIREKKIDCKNYREVDIVPRTDEGERTSKGKRNRKKNVSPPKQKNLNDKNARRYLVQLGNGNFGSGDIHLTNTYDEDHVPKTIEEAEKEIHNYLRRIAYRRKKLKLEPLKYILVTEYREGDDGNLSKRVHHHIIMNGGLSRDEIEMMWTKDRINWRKYEKDPSYGQTIKRMGWTNADRLQVNQNGIEGLCKYITKDPRGKKRWSSSRNLERPVQQRHADHKYSRGKVERLAKQADAGREYFEKQFPKYHVGEINPEYYEDTGWHIYIKMWKKGSGRSG